MESSRPTVGEGMHVEYLVSFLSASLRKVRRSRQFLEVKAGQRQQGLCAAMSGRKPPQKGVYSQ